MHHELQLEKKGVASWTAWGWLARCRCGWVQEVWPWSTKKHARREYYRHKAAA